MKKAALLVIFACALAGNYPITVECQTAHKTAVRATANRYYRTELYFGRSIPGGGGVTDEEWEDFLLDEVTALHGDATSVELAALADASGIESG